MFYEDNTRFDQLIVSEKCILECQNRLGDRNGRIRRNDCHDYNCMINT